MIERLTIYIVGDFKSGAADGLAEFNYQNVKLLEDTFNFEFIEFDKEQSSDYYQTESREGITVHRFGTLGLKIYHLSRAFCKWLDMLAPKQQIFHLSHIWNINNYLIARKLVKAGIPYLITPHDSYVYDRPFNLGKPFLKRIYRKLFVQFVDKYVLDHAKTVHALTAQCVPSLQIVTNSKITVVGNQVRDVQVPLVISQIKPQVCFVGRLSIFQKGVDLALEAFAGFRKHKSKPDVTFVLVGPADERSDRLTRGICRTLGLEVGKDVVFTGRISENERNTQLQVSKVYLQMSRYEGFGLSVAQALSAFKPVIVSAGIPFGPAIVSHHAGFVVNNEEEAAEALLKIFAMSEEQYSTMAHNARQCYEKEFHPNVIKPKLIELYESTLIYQ